MAEITVGWNPETKKRVTDRKGGFKTLADAKAHLTAMRVKLLPLNDEVSGNVSVTKTVSLSDLWQTWTPAREKLSKSKREAYSIAFEKLSDLSSKLVYRGINTLTIEDLQRGVDEKGSSYYTKRDIRVVLSHLYNLAMAQQYVEVNLAKFIVLPTLEEEEAVPFNKEEQTAFWNDYIAGNTFTGYILLMIYTGMMPGELMKATKDMIRWDEQVILGAGIKTKKRKKAPLVVADIMLPVLKSLCEYSNGKKLLTMNKDNFYKVYKETIVRCGCRELPPYSCRHTTGTALGLGDVPQAVAQEIITTGTTPSCRYRR